MSDLENIRLRDARLRAGTGSYKGAFLVWAYLRFEALRRLPRHVRAWRGARLVFMFLGELVVLGAILQACHALGPGH